MTTKKKIIHISDDESDCDEDKNNEQSDTIRKSFISSKIIENYHNILVNSDKYLKKLFENKNTQEDSSFEQQQPQQKTLLVQKKKAEIDDKEIILISDNDDEDNIKTVNKRKNKNLRLPKKKEFLNYQEIHLNDKEDLIEINDCENDISKSAEKTYDTDFQEFVENAPIRIKIKRLDRIENFSLLRNCSISTILDEIGARFNISVPRIILYLNDNIVDAKSTPKSLNLSVADIFEILCRYEPTNSENTNVNNKSSTKDDPNFVELHLRDDSKKRLTCAINRFELVRKLAEIYSKEKNVPVDHITLKFDSDAMSFDEKIDLYELENDDQIDVIIKS